MQYMSLMRRQFIGLMLLAVLVSMTIGGVLSSEMMMDEDGMMHDCPFMGVAAICNMSPLEHLSEWQTMFTATSQQFGTAVLLLLLILVLLWSFATDLSPPKQSSIPIVSLYSKRERIFDPLRLAFARGIIHPKVF